MFILTALSKYISIVGDGYLIHIVTSLLRYRPIYWEICVMMLCWLVLMNVKYSSSVHGSAFVMFWQGQFLSIQIRSWRCDCLFTWFCYQMIAKPGNKVAAPLWPGPYILYFLGTGAIALYLMKQPWRKYKGKSIPWIAENCRYNRNNKTKYIKSVFIFMGYTVCLRIHIIIFWWLVLTNI